MLPIVDSRSDGYENLIGALLVAGSYWIPQVLVYFNSKLLRGNRTIKISCQDKQAFSSPNFDHIGEMGVNIRINWRLVLKPLNQGNFNVFTRLRSKISSLHITPMMHQAVFAAAFNPQFDAVVIQGYAMGNFPSKRKQLTDIISNALKQGTIVVMTSQVNKGVVIDTYQVLKDLVQAGALISYDMTFPCVLAKLSYLLGKYKKNKKKVRELFVQNLRGQLTDINAAKNLFSNGKFVCAVAQVLNTSLPQDFQAISQELNPYFVNAIASRGNETTMHALKIGGFDFDQIDKDGNSPLHQAAKWGKIDVVKFLCKKGRQTLIINDQPFRC